MTPTEAAYVAGLIDGEGSISLHRRRQARRRECSYKPSLDVSNTDIPMIEALVRMTGLGGVTTSDQREGKRRMWRWRLSPNEVRIVLPQVLPYLITKRERGELLSEYLGLVKQSPIGMQGAELERSQELYEKLHALNQRGALAPEYLGLKPRATCSEDGCEEVTYYSSDVCRKHWEARASIPRPCTWCGEMMLSRRPSKKFCCWRCANAAGGATRVLREQAERVAPKCIQCAVVMDGAKASKQYCSPACRAQYHAEKRLETFPERTCIGCGVAFKPNRRFKVYCTPACGCKARRHKYPR